MTHPEKDRIDNAEKAIVGLSGRLDGVESRLGHVELAVGETNEGVNKLLARTGGLEQTRGMVPVTHLWAAAALFASLVGVGITMLTLFDSSIKREIVEDREKIDTHREESEAARNELQQEMRELDHQQIKSVNDLDKFLQLELSSAASLNETKRQTLKTEVDQRFIRVDGDLEALEAQQKDFRDTYFLPLDARVRAMEGSGAHGDDLERLKERISALEVFAARVDERVEKSWEEIEDHEDELDHPIRQTYEIDAIKRELDHHVPATEAK